MRQCTFRKRRSLQLQVCDSSLARENQSGLKGFAAHEPTREYPSRAEWKCVQSCRLDGKAGEWAHSANQKWRHSLHNAPSKNTDFIRQSPKEKKQFVSIIDSRLSLKWKLTASGFACASRLPQPCAMRSDSAEVKCHDLLWVSQACSGPRRVHSPGPQRHSNQNSSLPCAPVPSPHRHTHYLWMGVARAPSCPVALLECYKQIDGSRGNTDGS